MVGVISASVLYFFAAGMIYFLFKDKKIKDSAGAAAAISVIFFVIKLIAAHFYYGHKTDMSCFSGWADMLFRNGFSKFYSSSSFTDYPPGYMYILYFVGLLRHIFGTSAAIVKLPAVAADALCGVAVWRYARKKGTASVSPTLLLLIYSLNPAVFVNSAMWGQVDSVLTLFMAVSVILLSEKKYTASYLIYAYSLMIKPQAAIIAPVFIFSAAEEIFGEGFSARGLKKQLAAIMGAALLMLAVMLPFGVGNVLKQYFGTLSSYEYASVNAFNLWAALGLNWSELTPAAELFGYIFIGCTVAVSCAVYFKTDERVRCFACSAVLLLGTVMLSVKMHERYLYPAMLFLLLMFVLPGKGRDFLSYLLVSVSQYINTAYILFVYQKNPSQYMNTAFVRIFSALNVLLLIYCVWSVFQKKPLHTPRVRSGVKPGTALPLKMKRGKITRLDIAIMLAIAALYSAAAFYNLGDRAAPETGIVINAGEQIVLEAERESEFSRLMMFNGEYQLDESNTLELVFYDSEQSMVGRRVIEKSAVFYWSDTELSGAAAKYVVISSSGRAAIRELAFYDEEGRYIKPIKTEDTAPLFDERDIVPETSSYRNSTYFDEIYHARTAYEFNNRLAVYEWTHPPLGKVIIALGIRLFGMNPFGWRFCGVIFGILMLPAVYILIKRMTDLTRLAAVGCAVFALDFMHFTQTRIATIDVFVVFFIILSYLFMYEYVSCDFGQALRKRRVAALGACGICFGLSVACKWTGLYSGAGLCIIFFLKLWLEYRSCKRSRLCGEEGELVRSFRTETVKTLAFCVLFFVAVPLIIYVLSYIPYMRANGTGFAGILKNQKDMLTYHGKTVLSSQHPYSSRWYEWIVMARPIWYYSGIVNGRIREGISAFGNPAVWWGGIAAFFCTVYAAVKRQDRTAAFLAIGYLAQLLPWVMVTRVTFIYHYFTCVPFLVMMIAYTFYLFGKKYKKTVYFMAVYVIAAAVLFVMFYPVISGYPVDYGYVVSFLRWFKGWVLISTAA